MNSLLCIVTHYGISLFGFTIICMRFRSEPIEQIDWFEPYDIHHV